MRGKDADPKQEKGGEAQSICPVANEPVCLVNSTGSEPAVAGHDDLLYPTMHGSIQKYLGR